MSFTRDPICGSMVVTSGSIHTNVTSCRCCRWRIWHSNLVHTMIPKKSFYSSTKLCEFTPLGSRAWSWIPLLVLHTIGRLDICLLGTDVFPISAQDCSGRLHLDKKQKGIFLHHIGFQDKVEYWSCESNLSGRNWARVSMEYIRIDL